MYINYDEYLIKNINILNSCNACATCIIQIYKIPLFEPKYVFYMTLLSQNASQIKCLVLSKYCTILMKG